jgi:hypothetical protein
VYLATGLALYPLHDYANKFLLLLGTQRFPIAYLVADGHAISATNSVCIQSILDAKFAAGINPIQICYEVILDFVHSSFLYEFSFFGF